MSKHPSSRRRRGKGRPKEEDKRSDATPLSDGYVGDEEKGVEIVDTPGGPAALAN